ncbi:hypothetical protein COV19_03890 [Candidatus Woesearchaeota archaeon CG10_big_fil_rev_8_21_14_0_10_44_13]|nr:MAG: hypothetical protein COV19_03890 [Candidatus Woesearchaeota archaeon CG10_big_fil_rev_8_21_14_0_10_44_13]
MGGYEPDSDTGKTYEDPLGDIVINIGAKKPDSAIPLPTQLPAVSPAKPSYNPLPGPISEVPNLEKKVVEADTKSKPSAIEKKIKKEEKQEKWKKSSPGYRRRGVGRKQEEPSGGMYETEEIVSNLPDDPGSLLDSLEQTAEEEAYSTEESPDLEGERTVLQMYLAEMDKYPLLTPEQEIELARGMEGYLKDAADILFNKLRPFSSKYLNAVLNGANGDGCLNELMPKKDYGGLGKYLAHMLKESDGGSDQDKPRGRGNLAKSIAGAKHEYKHLNEIYNDFISMRQEIIGCKKPRQRKAMLDELGIKSPEEMDMYLISTDKALENYMGIFHRFTTSNLRLVVKIANKYRRKVMQISDLIQEGNIGLMRAAEKFDYKRGYKFSSYATWWVHQSIIRALAEKSTVIRIPIYLSEKMKRAGKIQNQIWNEKGRDATPEEVAAKMGINVDELAKIIEADNQPISLHKPIGYDGDSEIIDTIPINMASPEQETSESQLGRQVEELLETLTPREEKILRMRYGIGEKHDMTLEEIGEEFVLSRERIRQIEKKSLKKLRHPSKSRFLRPYTDGSK